MTLSWQGARRSMWPRLRMWWGDLTESLWFIPAAMLVAAGLLAVLMVELSTQFDREALSRYPRLFGASAQSSRDMLATIAGAMMTVAGVTFSITVLALAQASSQYSPRILRNFMRDRPSQVTLGTLTGVFVYCLVVMRTIRGVDELRFIPSLAVLLAVILAIVGIGALIYFIHHIATSLEATHILERVRVDTLAAIDRRFPAAEQPVPATASLAVPPAEGTIARAHATGYITSIDVDGLLGWCDRREAVVSLKHAVGDFVIEGTPLLTVLCSTDLDVVSAHSLARTVTIAPHRTVQHDPVFGIRQMVDIAVKALSPGVNDTTTAIVAVDAIGAVLFHLAGRADEPPMRIRDGRGRVTVCPTSWADVVGVASDEIRRSAVGNVSVLVRLLGILATAGGATQRLERREVLRDHARRVWSVADASVADNNDRAEIELAYRRMLDATVA